MAAANDLQPSGNVQQIFYEPNHRLNIAKYINNEVINNQVAFVNSML